MNKNTPMLLVDHCFDSSIEIDLNESNLEKGLVKFRGKFQEADAINKNRRKYSYRTLDENVKRLNEEIKSRGLIGELDHPADSIIHFEKSSHVITGLWWDGNVLMGEAEVLNTPCGKVLKALINDGVRVGISSRGVGNGKTDGEGILVIDESYKLITFDAVADPSTYKAFQKRITSNKREHVYVPEMPEFDNSEDMPNKNEANSINKNKVSKEALIAVLGGLFKENTEKIKHHTK